MLKKLAMVSAFALVVGLPLAAQAGDRDHGGHFGSPVRNAPEIDGGDMVLAMTLLAGVVTLVRRSSKNR